MKFKEDNRQIKIYKNVIINLFLDCSSGGLINKQFGNYDRKERRI